MPIALISQKRGPLSCWQRSPWHLKSSYLKAEGTMASCCYFIFSALVFDITSPSARTSLTSGEIQGRLPEVRLVGPCHGSSTPQGSLAAALLAWSPYWELGRGGSIPRQESWRDSPPQAAFGTGGTAGHIIWPSFTHSQAMRRWSWRTLRCRLALSGRCRERVQNRL